MSAQRPTLLMDIPSAGPARRVRPTGSRGGRPGWIVHAAVLAGCGALLAAGIFSGGFLSFASRVTAMETRGAVSADGVVALTGGAERVRAAMELLAGGKARRLLISGVHPDTTARQIGALVDADPDLLACCVDLDRRASNTIGNAAETAKWARSNDFGSLIVVTSAYHMPRSISELSAAMPDVTLRPYAVSPESLSLDRWYLSAGTTVLLLEEYLKYTASQARLALDEAGMASPLLADIAP